MRACYEQHHSTPGKTKLTMQLLGPSSSAQLLVSQNQKQHNTLETTALLPGVSEHLEVGTGQGVKPPLFHRNSHKNNPGLSCEILVKQFLKF